MDYYGRKHSQNFPRIAEEAAAFARDKLSREIKSVPHIKLTKSQLEFILNMPKPMVKWFEHGGGGWGTGEVAVELLTKFKINQKDEELKRQYEEISIMKEQLGNVNASAWSLHDVLNGDTYRGRMHDIKRDVKWLLTCLGHDVYLPHPMLAKREGKPQKLICRGDTTSWSPWKLKTEQDAKL